MVGSILPGFREFRTPLIAGCLYFLCAWIAFGGGVLLPRSHPNDPAAQRLDSLIDLVGPGVTLAAFAVAAYLVGSLTVIRRWPAGLPHLIAGIWGHRSLFFDLDESWEGPRGMPHHFRYWLESRGKDDYETMDELAGSFDEFVTTLQLQSERVHDEYDRLQSEAELRWSIMFPFAGLSIIYAAQSSHWWIGVAGLLISLVWLAQGIRLHSAARMKVWAALMHGVISTPVLDDGPNDSDAGDPPAEP